MESFFRDLAETAHNGLWKWGISTRTGMIRGYRQTKHGKDFVCPLQAVSIHRNYSIAGLFTMAKRLGLYDFQMIAIVAAADRDTGLPTLISLCNFYRPDIRTRLLETLNLQEIRNGVQS